MSSRTTKTRRRSARYSHACQKWPGRRPSSSWAISARAETDTLEINGVTFASRVLSVNLKDIHRVFAYVVTCGREFDAIDTEGDPLQQYWLDQMRMVALGTAREYFWSYVTERYQPGQALPSGARLPEGLAPLAAAPPLQVAGRCEARDRRGADG